MAPTAPAPRKRTTARQKALARLADPTLPRKVHRENNAVTDSFISSKKDKRLIKHSAFVSKIHKARPAVAKKKRRPSKKLVTTLETMADALAEIKEDMQAEGAMDDEQAKQGKVRHQSMKSRPGALKRKEKLVRSEMQRFDFNLAQLATVKKPEMSGPAKIAGRGDKATGNQGGKAAEEAAPASGSATSQRWATLRNFISSTMEQNPAFMTNT